jgi:ferredoxin
MKVRLNKERCAGHALCYATSPELFPLDEGGYSALVEVQIPVVAEGVAREGVNACPEVALFIDEG